MPNFLIVDDHTSVREGLRRLFEAEYPGSGIGFTATPSGCLNAMQEHSWDLIVLDISLPQRDGLSLIPEIKDISPNTQVLVHTMHGEEQFGVRAIKSGADGFVTKDAPVARIVQAIKALMTGGRYVSERLADLLAAAVGKHDRSGSLASLSDRELQVLQYITSARTPTQIAEHLGLSVKTVSTYRSRILEKMGMKTNADLTYYAIKNGLVE